MPTSILDNHSLLMKTKNRNGLNRKTSSNKTSEFIEMKQLIREITTLWQCCKEDFAKRFYGQRRFDPVFLSNLPIYLQTIPLSKLKQIHSDILEEGVESYLIIKMKLKQN